MFSCATHHHLTCSLQIKCTIQQLAKLIKLIYHTNVNKNSYMRLLFIAKSIQRSIVHAQQETWSVSAYYKQQKHFPQMNLDVIITLPLPYSNITYYIIIYLDTYFISGFHSYILECFSVLAFYSLLHLQRHRFIMHATTTTSSATQGNLRADLEHMLCTRTKFHCSAWSRDCISRFQRYIPTHSHQISNCNGYNLQLLSLLVYDQSTHTEAKIKITTTKICYGFMVVYFNLFGAVA